MGDLLTYKLDNPEHDLTKGDWANAATKGFIQSIPKLFGSPICTKVAGKDLSKLITFEASDDIYNIIAKFFGKGFLSEIKWLSYYISTLLYDKAVAPQMLNLFDDRTNNDSCLEN